VKKLTAIVVFAALILVLAACGEGSGRGGGAAPRLERREDTRARDRGYFDDEQLPASFFTNARISSHNSWAATMRNQITYFLAESQQRNAGYSSSNEMILEITAIAQGQHTVTIISGGSWSDWFGTLREGTWKEAVEDYLDECMPDTIQGAVYHVVIANNAARACAYWADGGNPVTWDENNQRFMDGNTEIKNGRAGNRIIGTSPMQN
jgi:hypothetical protein